LCVMALSTTEVAFPESVMPDLLPINTRQQSALSVDNPASQNDYMTYQPYNTFPQEIDLWELEKKRLIYSIPVLSPDKSQFVYSEISFLPSLRQTYSRLYVVPTPPLPLYPARLPSEPLPPVIQLSAYHNRFSPLATMQTRQLVTQTGTHYSDRFGFKTLTVVDWSASGQKILIRERSGMLHLGLRTSNIVVYDEQTGVTTIYPEVHRVISYYWKTKKNLENLPQLSFDIVPLGWQANSNTVVLLKAWVYEQDKKQFLGIWQYDIAEERTWLLQLEDTTVEVAANGWMAQPVEMPTLEAAQKTRWEKVKAWRPFESKD
jgi:hypothetical protein